MKYHPHLVPVKVCEQKLPTILIVNSQYSATLVSCHLPKTWCYRCSYKHYIMSIILFAIWKNFLNSGGSLLLYQFARRAIKLTSNYCRMSLLSASYKILSSIIVSRLKWAGHVAQMGRRGMHVGYWWESRNK
jgi:hypothetical protein